MTDIEARLRYAIELARHSQFGMPVPICIEVADEIGKLRKDRDTWQQTANYIEQLKDAEIKRLRAVITRAKDALLDGQSTQWVHDLLVDL